MFRVGEQLITKKYEPQGTELVSFGKHANMTYLDLKIQCPDYAQWVMNTDTESEEASWRLRRLAKWLRVNPGVALQPKSNTKTTRGQKSSEKGSASSFSLVSNGLMSDASLDLETKEAEIAGLEARIAQLEEDQWPDQIQKSRSKTRKET